MIQYRMSDLSKDLFLSGDEGRGTVRREATEAHPDADSIQIIDSEGTLFDVVTGIDATTNEEPGLAIVLTDEQLEARRTQDALDAADASRLETEIRPTVISKLRSEAAAEIRAEYAEQIRNLRTENLQLKSQVQRLTEGVNSLAKRETDLTAELAVARARQ